MRQPLVRGFSLLMITKFNLFLLIFGLTTGSFSVFGLSNLYILPEEPVSDFIIVQENSILPVSPLPDPKVVERVKVIATAYSSSPDETDDEPFITAAGTYVRDGIVANNLLPFGTRIRIPELYGDKVFVVEDRMNRKKGSYHFDIWFPSKKEALQFGAKNIYVEILEG